MKSFKIFPIFSLFTIIFLSWQNQGPELTANENKLAIRLSISKSYLEIRNIQEQLVNLTKEEMPMLMNKRRRFSKAQVDAVRNDKSISEMQRNEKLDKMGYGMTKNFKNLADKTIIHYQNLNKEIPEFNSISRASNERIWRQARLIYNAKAGFSSPTSKL